jgi:hypothetical protein
MIEFGFADPIDYEQRAAVLATLTCTQTALFALGLALIILGLTGRRHRLK